MGKVKLNEGLINACKFCIYPTNIEDKTIDIPEAELSEGSEELSVRYLISTYGFKIQSCIGSVQKKERFNPELSERSRIIVKGLAFKNISTNAKSYITDEPENGMCIVRDMDNGRDKPWKCDELLRMLKSGKYIIIQNK